MYAVVSFDDEQSVAGVPESWLIFIGGKTFCKWPKAPSFRLPLMVKQLTEPENDWPKFPCRIFCKVGTHEEMLEKQKRGQFVSEVDSTDSETRHKKIHHKLTHKSSETIFSSEDEACSQMSKPSVSQACAYSSSDASPLPSPPSHLLLKGKSHTKRTVTLTELEELKSATCELKEFCEKHYNNITKAIDAYRKDVIVNQENTNQEIKLIKKMLKKNITSIQTEESKLPEFPLQSIEQVLHLEKIIEDPTQKKILVHELASIGGSKLSGTVYNVMRHVLGKTVSMSYSLKGVAKKMPFCKLDLYKCVIDAVQQSPHGKSSTIHEINHYIALSLINARDREKGRCMRRMVSAQRSTEESSHEGESGGVTGAARCDGDSTEADGSRVDIKYGY